MPVFLYSCCGCWDQFEARRPVAERDDPIRCPECGTAAVREFTPQVQIRQPCADWTRVTARAYLGPKSEKVVVTVGAPKVPPRV